MSRLTKSLAIGAMAGMAVAGVAAPASAARPVEPVTHNPAYWEAYWADMGLDVTCDKEEFGDGIKRVELGDAVWMYVKAGTAYFESQSYDITTVKDISFVIRCYGEPSYPS